MTETFNINNYLIFIAACCIMIMLLLSIKKILLKKNKIAKSAIDLKIINKIHLHSKSYLYIVSISDKMLLIGVSDNHISTLADLTQDYSINEKSDKAVSSNTNNYTLPKNNISDNPLSFRNFILSGIKKEKKN